MTFAVDGLPDGLQLDAATGRIPRALKEKAEYAVTFHAVNAAGNAEKRFRIVVGDDIALKTKAEHGVGDMRRAPLAENQVHALQLVQVKRAVVMANIEIGFAAVVAVADLVYPNLIAIDLRPR